MQKFYFKLDRVLDYKNQILDGLVGEHAVIKAEIGRQEEVLKTLQEEFAGCCKSMNVEQRAGTQVMNMYVYENYLEVLGHRMKEQGRMLEFLYKQEEVKSGQVLEAKKESVSMEKLKDKKKEAYQKELQKSQEKELDEFISNTRRRLGTFKTGA